MADVEKSYAQEHHEQLERVSTHDDVSSNREKLEEVQTHETLIPVDIHNRQAFKGDESDGKIHWTIRRWFAAAFLAMLYTGETLHFDVTTSFLNIGHL